MRRGRKSPQRNTGCQTAGRYRSVENGLDQHACLKHALDIADEIGAAIFDGVVRLIRPVDGQRYEEPVSIALPAMEYKIWTLVAK